MAVPLLAALNRLIVRDLGRSSGNTPCRVEVRNGHATFEVMEMQRIRARQRSGMAEGRAGISMVLAIAGLGLIGAGLGSYALLSRLQVNKLQAQLEEEQSEARRFEYRAAVDRVLFGSPETVPEALEELLKHGDRMVRYVRQRLSAQHLAGDAQLHGLFALAALGERDDSTLVHVMKTSKAEQCPNFVNAFSLESLQQSQYLRYICIDAMREEDWSYAARLAITLLFMGDPDLASEMLAFRDNATPRTAFISEFKTWHGDISTLGRQIPQNYLEDPAFRSGLIISIGSIPASDIDDTTRQEWRYLANSWANNAPDGCSKNAGAWAVRKLRGVDYRDVSTASYTLLPEEWAELDFGDPQWETTSLNATMMRISSGTFRRQLHRRDEYGLLTPTSIQQSVRISQEFLIGTSEVTRGEFFEFLTDSIDADSKPEDWRTRFMRIASPNEPAEFDVSLPIVGVQFEDAVLFCNWLSLREDLTPCYELIGEAWVVDASKNGYRLPTEAEWEYASRAGTATKFVSGDDVSALTNYTNIPSDRPQPVGMNWPNAFGLFDIHGNAAELCHSSYPSDDEQLIVVDPVLDPSTTTLRGGSFQSSADEMSFDYIIDPTHANSHIQSNSPSTGFRLTRTP